MYSGKNEVFTELIGVWGPVKKYFGEDVRISMAVLSFFRTKFI
jgi:hypothetical protein